MIVTALSLNGKKVTCSECDNEEFLLQGFKTTTYGKKYYQLEAKLTCSSCNAEKRLRTGKIKELIVR